MPSSKSDPKAKKKKHCENCGHELDEDAIYELNGMILCWIAITKKKTYEALKRNG